MLHKHEKAGQAHGLLTCADGVHLALGNADGHACSKERSR